MPNDGKRTQAGAIDVHSVEDRVLDDHFEIASALIEIANTGFEIFVELLAVEGLVHDGYIEEP